MKRLCAYLIILLLLSCNANDRQDERSGTLFSLLDNKQTGIDFANELTDKEDANIFLHRNFYNGGGVAIGDVNNDGWNDVFLTSNQGDNKLYLNKGKVNGVASWQF